MLTVADQQVGFFDAAELCHVVPEYSFYALLAEHGTRIVRNEDFEERDDAHAHRLASLEDEVAPAAVKALLGAPSDVDHAWVLAAVAAAELVADPGGMAVVVGGLDEQAAGVAGAGLGDRALAALGARGVLAGHDAEEGRQSVGVVAPSGRVLGREGAHASRHLCHLRQSSASSRA